VSSIALRHCSTRLRLGIDVFFVTFALLLKFVVFSLFSCTVCIAWGEIRGFRGPLAPQLVRFQTTKLKNK
jgi:hypothetical protein